jgi:hypothetical protein
MSKNSRKTETIGSHGTDGTDLADLRHQNGQNANLHIYFEYNNSPQKAM